MLYKTTARFVQTKEDLFKKETRDALSSVQVYVDMVNKSMNDLRQDMEMQKNSISYLLEQLHQKIDALDLKTQKGIGDCLDYTQKVTSQQYDTISQMQLQLSGRNVLQNDVTSIKQKMDELNQEMIRFKSEIREYISQSIDQIEKKNLQFIQEVKSIPSEASEIKKQLEEKIDVISLDGSNALLRSSNCEKHLNLIEKKIECIMLLIKKIDLTQQEK
jgi:cell division septum initiation protein DivIVA